MSLPSTLAHGVDVYDLRRIEHIQVTTIYQTCWHEASDDPLPLQRGAEEPQKYSWDNGGIGGCVLWRLG